MPAPGTSPEMEAMIVVSVTVKNYTGIVEDVSKRIDGYWDQLKLMISAPNFEISRVSIDPPFIRYNSGENKATWHFKVQLPEDLHLLRALRAALAQLVRDMIVCAEALHEKPTEAPFAPQMFDWNGITSTACIGDSPHGGT